MSSNDKEKKREDEVRALARLDSNKKCFDCSKTGPHFNVVTDLLIFVCTDCAGIHRSFRHKAKSVGMTTFTEKEVFDLKLGGNKKAAKKWLVNIKKSDLPTDSTDTAKIKEFMKNCFELKKYMGKPENDDHEDMDDKPSSHKKSSLKNIDVANDNVFDDTFSPVKKSPLSASKVSSKSKSATFIEDEEDPFGPSEPFSPATIKKSEIPTKEHRREVSDQLEDFFTHRKSLAILVENKVLQSDIFDSLYSTPAPLIISSPAPIKAASNFAAGVTGSTSLEQLLKDYILSNYLDFPTFWSKLGTTLKKLPGYDERIIRANPIIQADVSVNPFLERAPQNDAESNPFLSSKPLQNRAPSFNPFANAAFPPSNAPTFANHPSDPIASFQVTDSSNLFNSAAPSVKFSDDSTIATRRQLPNLTLNSNPNNYLKVDFNVKPSFPQTAPALNPYNQNDLFNQFASSSQPPVTGNYANAPIAQFSNFPANIQPINNDMGFTSNFNSQLSPQPNNVPVNPFASMNNMQFQNQNNLSPMPTSQNISYQTSPFPPFNPNYSNQMLGQIPIQNNPNLSSPYSPQPASSQFANMSNVGSPAFSPNQIPNPNFNGYQPSQSIPVPQAQSSAPTGPDPFASLKSL